MIKAGTILTLTIIIIIMLKKGRKAKENNYCSYIMIKEGTIPTLTIIIIILMIRADILKSIFLLNVKTNLKLFAKLHSHAMIASRIASVSIWEIGEFAPVPVFIGS